MKFQVRRNINNLRYADDTTLMAERAEDLNSLLMMTNLDSVLKSRDIILLTKTCIVKAIIFFFFLVVKYGCESWTIKKAEHRRIDAFEL